MIVMEFVLNDSDGDGVCDELEIEDCTNPNAFNYNPSLTVDSNDDLCIIFGCTDLLACNYNEIATEDFEGLLCEYPTFGFDCDGNCLFDLNNGDCEELGCTDELACNFDENTTTDDGSCEYAVEYYDFVMGIQLMIQMEMVLLMKKKLKVVQTI